MQRLTRLALALCVLAMRPGVAFAREPDKASAPDLSHLNFVATPQGPLGNLLARTGCVLRAPPTISFRRTLNPEDPRTGEIQLLQLTVDCDIIGPRYFTHGGLVLFLKDGASPWRPFSFLASRIARYSPGAWFIKPDPQERQAFKMVTDAVAKAGLPPADAPEILRQMELENDGSMLRW